MGGRPKQARVYFRRDGTRVLVVSVHADQDGVPVEAEGPLALTRWDGEALGESVKMALEQSSTVHRASKTTDQATLKASGEPSPQAFQAAYIRIDLSGDLNQLVLLDGIPDKGELTIRASLPFQASPADFTRKLTRVFEVCRDHRF